MKESFEKVWQYLSPKEINFYSDTKLQFSYRKNVKQTVKTIINPLYMYALRQGFDDTTFLKKTTIHGMVEELKSFYESKGIDHEGRVLILLEGRKK